VSQWGHDHSVAAGLAGLRLSREPSRVLADPSHVFGAGWTTSVRLDPLAMARVRNNKLRVFKIT
jgi:hypothetical protein